MSGVGSRGRNGVTGGNNGAAGASMTADNDGPVGSGGRAGSDGPEAGPGSPRSDGSAGLADRGGDSDGDCRAPDTDGGGGSRRSGRRVTVTRRLIEEM